MLELLTGTGLAFAAGLNAYIPLLVLGLSSRFFDFVQLPAGWTWLSNEWVLVILGVLLVIEIIADKIPAVDSVNDVIQTVVRPASGGIVFGSGAASQTALVDDPAAFFTSYQWVPIVIGIVIALLVHAGKAFSRPVLHAMTFGLAGPAVSASEDAGALALSISALLLPLLVIVLIIGIGIGLWALLRRRKKVPALTRDMETAAPEGTAVPKTTT
jgi:uncharacterized membrane protein